MYYEHTIIRLQGHTSEEWNILINATSKKVLNRTMVSIKTFNLENANANRRGKNMNDRGIT